MFFFLVFFALFLLPARPALADLPPVIIDSSQFIYPTSLGKDQNVSSNNPDKDDMDTFDINHDIQQSFNPICISSGSAPDTSSGCNTWAFQNIPKIDASVGDKQWNNIGFRQLFDFLVNLPKNIYANADERLQALSSYNLNDPSIGAANTSLRLLSQRDKLCQISYKIDQVVKYITCTSDPSTCAGSGILDEDVNNSGIRFSHAILALNRVSPSDREKNIGYANFYFKDNTPGCPEDEQPVPLPGGVVAAFSKYPGASPSDALNFFINNIEPGSGNSIAMTEQQGDLHDDSSIPPTFKELPKSINMPLSASANSTVQAISYVIPENTDPLKLNFQQTQTNKPIEDTHNPVDWLHAIFYKLFWNAVLAVEKTFSGPTLIRYRIPKTTVEQPLQTQQTAATWFLPTDTIDQNNLNDLKASSTNGIGVQPGYSDAVVTQLLYKTLTPCEWQGNCGSL